MSIRSRPFPELIVMSWNSIGSETRHPAASHTVSLILSLREVTMARLISSKVSSSWIKPLIEVSNAAWSSYLKFSNGIHIDVNNEVNIRRGPGFLDNSRNL
jgi:hypothetical protein